MEYLPGVVYAGMAGGSYRHSLTSTFFPELLSMNCLMAGMVPVMAIAMNSVPASRDPSGPAFWFIMSMALLVGFITVYPMNWWLVSRHLKHGMMTVRAPEESISAGAHTRMKETHSPSELSGVAQKKTTPSMEGDEKMVSKSVLTWMTILSFIVFGVGLSIAIIFGGL